MEVTCIAGMRFYSVRFDEDLFCLFGCHLFNYARKGHQRPSPRRAEIVNFTCEPSLPDLISRFRVREQSFDVEAIESVS